MTLFQGKAASRVQLFLAGCIAAGTIVTLVVLASEVIRKLEQLDSARSDNVQWTLSQVEVEFLEFELSLAHSIAAATPDTDQVREEFDVFYSRVMTISESGLFARLRADPRYSDVLDQVRGFLAKAAVPIDESDDVLQSALPSLVVQTAEMHAAVRRLSAFGLTLFAQQADENREGVATTLLLLGIAALALLTVLLLAAAFLFRLYRLSEKRAETQRRTSSRLQTVVGSSLDAIIVADKHGKIVEFNPAAEAIFGYAGAEVLGKTIGEVVVPETHRAAHEAGLARYRETGKKRVIGQGRVQLQARRADGNLFPIEMSIQSDEAADGELFVSFIRDISKQLEAERELVEARDQAVAGEKAKTEFLAVMSHEIRTPLNGLLGTMTLLQDTRLNTKQRGYLENMQTSGHLLLRHANDVLDVTKLDAGKMTLETTDVDLGELAQSVIDNQRDLAAATGTTITWSWCSEPLKKVRTDPFRLRQVLINLLSNAVKFTHDGRISVEIEAEQVTASSAEVTLRVVDTGIGIAPQDIDRLFDDFETADASYSRKTGGTGLGLGICRRLVSALGGSIGAESELGEGSVFWISLPVDIEHSNAQSEAPERGTDQNVPSLPKSVLIVEDNEINRIVLRGHLEADGHTVTEAHNGSEGVTIAGKERFDMILMDISMPVLDGIGAARSIRSGSGPNGKTPIVAVTAHAMPRQIEEFKAAGMDGFVSKPIDRSALRGIMAGQCPAFFDQVRRSQTVPNAQITDLQAALPAHQISDLFQRFWDEGDAFAAELCALDKLDTRDLAEKSHKLAGSAAILGFYHLKEQLNTLETVSGTPAKAEKAAQRFLDDWSSMDRNSPALEQA